MAGSTTPTTGRGRPPANSPKQEDFPDVRRRGGENPRGAARHPGSGEQERLHARSLLDAAFDSYLRCSSSPCRRCWRPTTQPPAADPLKTKLAEPIAVLRAGTSAGRRISVPTSLAVFWGEDAHGPRVPRARKARTCSSYEFMEHRPTRSRRSEHSPRRSDKLTARFRNLADAVGRDQPVPTPHRRHRAAVQRRGREHSGAVHVGALGIARVIRRAGLRGNEEDVRHERQQLCRHRRIRRSGVGEGGHRRRQSGDPASTHFNDQAARYATGDLRDVYFYPEQLKLHTEREYHPGQQQE